MPGRCRFALRTLRREHNEDADDMSEQRMSRATKLGDADRRKSTREVSKRHTERAKSDLATRRTVSKMQNAASVWAAPSGNILDETISAGLTPEPNLKIGERV